jgi:hypothetical protein
VPEPIQGVGTNICQLDPSHDVSGASPPQPPICDTFSDHGGAEQPPHPGAVQKLVSASTVLPQPPIECLDKAADMVKSGGQLLAAGAALVASGPTLLGVLVAGTAFVALSGAFAASLAKYENCEDDAAAKAKPK